MTIDPETPQDDPNTELLQQIRDELAKANATPEEQQAADVTLDDLKALTTAEVMELDQRLVNSLLERGDQ